MAKNNKTIQFQAQVDSVTKKKDNTLSVKLGTQELLPDDTAHIFGMDSIVWVALSNVEIKAKDLDIPDFVAEHEGQKSYSQRTREVLYRVWEKKDNGVKKSSDQFYRDYMEKLITSLKEKID